MLKPGAGALTFDGTARPMASMIAFPSLGAFQSIRLAPRSDDARRGDSFSWRGWSGTGDEALDRRDDRGRGLDA